MTSTQDAVGCPCPECGEEVTVPGVDLVVGKRVRCLHCNAEGLVEQTFDPMKGAHHWVLESPDDDVPADRA